MSDCGLITGDTVPCTNQLFCDRFGCAKSVPDTYKQFLDDPKRKDAGRFHCYGNGMCDEQCAGCWGKSHTGKG